MTSKSKSYDDILPVLWRLAVSTRNIHTAARQTHRNAHDTAAALFWNHNQRKNCRKEKRAGEGGDTKASVPSPATSRRPHILAPTSKWDALVTHVRQSHISRAHARAQDPSSSSFPFFLLFFFFLALVSSRIKAKSSFLEQGQDSSELRSLITH